MPSQTDFLNEALIQCGADVITAIDDGSINANHCGRLYDSRRRAALEIHRWQFADWRVALVSTGTTPAFEWAYSYTLPADFIALRVFNGAELDTSQVAEWPYVNSEGYKIEGPYIYTNLGEVQIVYSRDITDPNRWTPLFYQMLATWLASGLALAIRKDHKMSQELLNQAIGQGLPMAAVVDSQQHSVSPYRADDLLRGR